MKQSKVCNTSELNTLYVMEMELITHVDIYHNYIMQCIPLHYDYTKVFFHLRIHNDRSQILLLRAFFCRLCPNDVLLMNMTWQITGG